MDVRIHDVESVEEIICTYKGELPFVTRTLRITDKNGVRYSLCMFSDTKQKLLTTDIASETYK